MHGTGLAKLLLGLPKIDQCNAPVRPESLPHRLVKQHKCETLWPDKNIARVGISMEEAFLEDHNAEGFGQGRQESPAKHLSFNFELTFKLVP